MNVSDLNEKQFKLYEKLIKAPVFTNTYKCSTNAANHEVFSVLTGTTYDVLDSNALIVYDITTDLYFFVADKNDNNYLAIDVTKNLLDIYFYDSFQYKADETFTNSLFSDFLIKSLFNDDAFNDIVEKFFYNIESRINEVSDAALLGKYINLIEAAETKLDYVLRCRDVFFICTTRFWKNDGLDYADDIFKTIWSKHFLKDINYSEQLSLLLDDISYYNHFFTDDNSQICGCVTKFAD